MIKDADKPTPLETQVDQLLTEARVIIPGVQALLGFQLTVTFTQAFTQLAQRFLVSNHIRQRRRFCRTKCG